MNIVRLWIFYAINTRNTYNTLCISTPLYGFQHVLIQWFSTRAILPPVAFDKFWKYWLSLVEGGTGFQWVKTTVSCWTFIVHRTSPSEQRTIRSKTSESLHCSQWLKITLVLFTWFALWHNRSILLFFISNYLHPVIFYHTYNRIPGLTVLSLLNPWHWVWVVREGMR